MELSRKVASAITTYAQNNHVDVIVFEYLEMKGKAAGKKKQKQRCTRGYKRYKETSGLIEWKECQIFHSIFT